MTGILTEVGRRLNNGWLLSVWLPGILFLAVAGCAITLGHVHALDADLLSVRVDATSAELRERLGRLVVAIGVVTVAAGIIGTTAGGLGALVERWWLRTQPARTPRAEALTASNGQTPIAAYLPTQPTAMSEQLRQLETRVRAQYWISATLAWPRIWLLANDTVRQPLLDARARFAEAVRLAGWSVLYLLVGLWWWPALLAAGVVYATAWWRARTSLAEFTDLVEAAVDTHHRALAAALGITLSRPAITKSEGALIDDQLRKAGPPDG
jgi:hypothetical protein